MFGIVDYAAEVFDLLLHQQTSRGLRYKPCDARGGSVRSMRRAKRIVDVNVAKAGELLRERVVVLLFFTMKAEIFEQQDVAVLQRLNFAARLLAYAI